MFRRDPSGRNLHELTETATPGIVEFSLMRNYLA
jgi:hypothetical protein